jgi:NADH dehydrogenase (ubiquinone) 1 alpha subcomplex subunit 5
MKYATGYALLDVEPFPRSKIMKLSYIILDKLKEIPEKALYRVYTEEKIKYIMKLTDEIEDIRTLEEEFGRSLKKEIPNDLFGWNRLKY